MYLRFELWLLIVSNNWLVVALSLVLTPINGIYLLEKDLPVRIECCMERHLALSI